MNKIYYALIVLAMLMGLASCSGNEDFDFEDFEKGGVFRMDFSDPNTTRIPPLGTSEIRHMSIPATGCDTIVEFVTPGQLFDILPYNGEEAIEVCSFRWSTFKIKASYVVENYIWQFAPVEISYEDIVFQNPHPMKLRIIANPNTSGETKTMLIDIERNYRDPHNIPDGNDITHYDWPWAIFTDMISFIALTQESLEEINLEE